VKRECIIFRSSETYARHIAVDFEDSKDLMDYFNIPKNEKKFDYIATRILEQSNMYFDLYEQIEENITCMIFFPNAENIRVYCQEVRIKGEIFCIIMSKILKKKSRGINKTIQSPIDALKKYDYEIKFE
jgi:hypothetical protein